MILSLRALVPTATPPSDAAASGVRIEHLLARPSKNGDPAVRGPAVDEDGLIGNGSPPLSALRDGDKLHLVGDGGSETVAGHSPAALVRRLADLGLARTVRLKQIHIIADNSGTGGAASFAQRFAEALAAEGFQVLAIKAPRGEVRSDPTGKVWIRPAGSGAFQPSEKELNYYTTLLPKSDPPL